MRITLSGIDGFTNLNQVDNLLQKSVEFAVLLTDSPDNRPRYPTLTQVHEIAAWCSPLCAIHICGGRARKNLMNGVYDDLFDAHYARRIQINGVLTEDETSAICDKFKHIPVITQHTSANAKLLNVAARNHCVLVDASGGQGVSPNEWLKPIVDIPTGYAGGLGYENLHTELPKIIKADAANCFSRSAWVDMEGKLRDEEDRFDINRAYKAVSAFYVVLNNLDQFTQKV